MKNLLILLFVLVSFPSCIIQAPKYTMVEQVLTLKEGMSKEEVSNVLGIPPYDFKSASDSGLVLIYKYRVTDRKVFPYNLKPTNGKKATGKYVDLFISYSKDGRVTSIHSCSTCEETKVAKINLGKLVTMMFTVALPSLLLYFGLK